MVNRPWILSHLRALRSIVLRGFVGALMLAKAVSIGLGCEFLTDVWSVRLVLGIGMSGVTLEVMLPSR